MTTDLAKLSARALLPSPQDPDAMAWAKSFCAINPDCGLDEGVMVGWFANAMMAMHDHLLNTRTGQLVERDAPDLVGANTLPTEYARWLSSIEVDVRVHDLTADEVARLIAALTAIKGGDDAA